MQAKCLAVANPQLHLHNPGIKPCRVILKATQNANDTCKHREHVANSICALLWVSLPSQAARWIWRFHGQKRFEVLWSGHLDMSRLLEHCAVGNNIQRCQQHAGVAMLHRSGDQLIGVHGNSSLWQPSSGAHRIALVLYQTDLKTSKTLVPGSKPSAVNATQGTHCLELLSR